MQGPAPIDILLGEADLVAALFTRRPEVPGHETAPQRANRVRRVVTGVPVMTRAGLLGVAAATAAAVWIVPEFPLAHLDDPSHWGVIGYATTVGVIARRWLGRLTAEAERRWMVLFLAGMPVIYLADWARFGGPAPWLALETAGFMLYGGLAWRSRRRPWLLPAGIGGHALWDALHYRRTDFVPDWYVVACIVIDAAVALYVAAGIVGTPSPGPAGRVTDRP